jgi:glycosyltransferase 2 family protein
MTVRKFMRLALGVLVAIGFIWLILRQVDGARIAAVVREARVDLLLAALLLLCAGYACRIERWHTMLQHSSKDLRFSECAGPLLASFAANNVLPFRAGDIMRSFIFNDRMRTTPGTVMATLFVERLLDLLMVILLLGLALWVFHFDVGRLLGVGAPLLLLAAAAILVVVLYPQVLKPVIKLLDGLAARLPAAGKLQAELDKATVTLSELAGGTTMWRLIAWSMAAWLLEGGVYWLTATALPSIVAPLGGWLAVPVGTLATLIPSTPGYVGTFDYFTAQAMVLAGNELASAAAFAFLVHMVLWLPPTVAGGLYMLIRPTHKTPDTVAKEHLT